MSIDSIKIKQAAKMKKVIVLLQMLLIISLSENTKAQIDTLRIFHLNDTHSCLAPLGPRNEFLQGTQGGIARAASVIGYSKATQKNVLALHAGDLSIGDPFFNNFLMSSSSVSFLPGPDRLLISKSLIPANINL